MMMIMPAIRIANHVTLLMFMIIYPSTHTKHLPQIPAAVVTQAPPIGQL
jgi:hypothetical protein